MLVDDEKLTKAAEARDDVLGESFAEMAEGCIVAEIGERQDCNRRARGRRFDLRCRRRRGQTIREDVAVELFRLGVGCDIEFLLQRVATGSIELYCLRTLAAMDVQTHEGAIDRFAYSVAR